MTVALNTPPDAGSDGSITLCSSDAPASLFAQLGGTPDAGGTWSGPSAVSAGMIDPASMSAGVYTYTVAGVAPCPDESATVTVTINAPPDPGTVGAIALCATSPPTSLFAVLGGSPDAGGTWSGPSSLNGALFDPTSMNAGTYTYTVNGVTPCPAASADVMVNVVSNPDPGVPGSITLCTSANVVDLFEQLGGSPDPGGTWTGPSAIVGGQFDPGTMAAGVYTYTINVPPPCVSVSSTVAVNLVQPPDAGTDGSLTLCISSPTTSLLSSLGGSPDAGGTWSGPSPVVGGSFNPASMAAGTYTYTVVGTAPCPASSADVLVNVVATPNAGSPGNITVCASDAVFDLFGHLGGTPDAGGAWAGPSAVVSGQFDPATMNAGVYTYTINVPPPCVNVSSTVTVAVVQPPNAGSDGSLTLCISSPATALLPSLGGSPDAGGNWSGPSPVGGGSFDPASMTAGTYTYTVAGTPPCPASSADVLVNVVATPDAGSPGNITVCASDAAFDLFGQLGGTPDAGGAWAGPSAVVSGQFDPATMNAGVYTYTINVPPPCMNVSSTVTVAVVQPPNAGSDGSLTLCISSPTTALLPSLGGSPDATGTWSGPSPVVGGSFNPASMLAGTYTYTVVGTTPCPASIADVVVDVVDAPNAGLPGSSDLCATNDAIVLFDQLGGTPDAGGTWSGPSTVSSGVFDPATMTAGVYTYTINVPPPCTNASSTVTINVAQPPNAGGDGGTTLCATSTSFDLITALSGSPDAGGVWSGPSPVIGGSFDPASMTVGLYTYTVIGAAPCPSASAGVEVNVVDEPDPGGPGFVTICATDDAVDLFTWIEGTPDAGGVWSGPSSLTDGSFDPAVHTAGIYTYTLTVPPPCTSASTTVTVDVVQPPDAGADGAIVLCATGAPIDLSDVLGGSPDAGGTWTNSGGGPAPGTFDPTSDIAGTFNYTVAGQYPCPNDISTVTISITDEPFAGNDAILNLCISGDPVNVFPSLGGADPGGSWTGPGNSAFDGTFTPGTSTPGDYVYQVTGTPPCPSASATVTVTQLTDPDAGVDGAVTLCSSNAPVSLFDQLGGSPDPGGVWLNSELTPIAGTFDPSAQPSDVLYYILSVPPPCVSDTSRVVMTVVTAVDAGEDATVASCSSGADIDLFATLGGNPDGGGNWMGPQGTTDGIFSPGTDPAGTYTYSVLATSPCPNMSATITVTIEAPPNAGLNGSASLCPEAAPINLFTLLGGSPDPGGTWTDPGGQSNSGTFDPGSDPAGTYTYTVLGEMCPDDVATASLTIYLVPTPNAGPDAISCDLTYDLNATGSWSSGSWSVPAGVTMEDVNSPSTMVSAPAGGNYTFSWNIVTAEGCTGSDSITVLFTAPMEGISTTTDAICHNACDGTASVAASGGNGGYTYYWSSAVAGDTAVATGLCAGSYSVAIADTNACAVSIPVAIGQPEPLTIDGVFTTPETCPGSCDGVLVVNDAAGVTFTIAGSAQSTPVFSGLCPGAYVVTMSDANGCTAQSAGLITSPPVVIPSFTYSPDTIFTNNTEVHFLNLSSSNAVTFSWTFGEEGGSPVEHPVYTFPGGLGGLYDICLTATDANGCSNTACTPLPIYDLLTVHVPNAFTPNGDGFNDDFLPIFNLPQVKDYQFFVFNRWGELIFNTNQPGKPWDGSYGGVVSQVDVYVWKLSCKDALSGDLIERIGHVSIVR
ncbi:MAG: gliding motility-associated C-terminal domain-containing protein [Flavobacteriales bacterium]|nr:gliding motility-associated C-terminal domain-containing protein [Flavobacteriales bacterium]